MPRNDTGATEQQKREAVDKALALMRGGMSQKKASGAVADEMGVGSATIRRWASQQGRSLTLATDTAARQQIAKARLVYRAAKVDDLAEIHNELVLVTRRDAHALFTAPEPDPKERSRLAMDVRRLAQTDRELAAMGASGSDTPEQEQHEDAEAAQAASRRAALDETRRRLSIVKSEAQG